MISPSKIWLRPIHYVLSFVLALKGEASLHNSLYFFDFSPFSVVVNHTLNHKFLSPLAQCLFNLKKNLMPFIRVWVHYVWSTKNREPTLIDRYRYPLFDHMKQNAKKKKIYIDRLNGYYDHVHCLISLGSDQTLEKIAQLIKGESSFWLNNKSGFLKANLDWQDEYFAVSVGESQLDTVRAYIDNQEKHHNKKTFAKEYEEFICKYGFEKFG